MTIKPNETRLRGEVLAVASAPDGRGFEVTVAVKSNESVAEMDFIQPGPGSHLKLFAADPPGLKIGDHGEFKARLLGGPFGERTVLTAAKKF